MTAIEVKQKVSLCPECTACPEVKPLHEERAVAVRIGEGSERVTLPRDAWNTLVRYIQEGVLSALYTQEAIRLLQFIASKAFHLNPTSRGEDLEAIMRSDSRPDCH